MAYKLLDMAEQRWRRLDGAVLLLLVRAGTTFQDGELVERIEGEGEERAA